MRRGKYDNLRRTSGNKEKQLYFLIVVEGETEENYFNSLKSDLKNRAINISLVSADGGDPLGIVNEAYRLFEQNIRQSKNAKKAKFDKIFCVFDDDNKPEKYKQAINTAIQYNFIAITTIPCFEFWFLLHYCYTTRSFVNYDDLKPTLEAELRNAGILKQRESYNKTDKKLYEKLKPNQDKAFAHADKLEQKHPNEDGCTNPSTKVHLLVKELQKQKNFE